MHKIKNKLLIISTILLLNMSAIEAQELKKLTESEVRQIENELIQLEDVSSQDLGKVNVELDFIQPQRIFAEVSKGIYLRDFDFKELHVVKGKNPLKKLLVFDESPRQAKLIRVPLEGDYILKHKNFIIEVKGERIFINRKELTGGSVVIHPNGKILWGAFLNYGHPALR